MLYALIMSNILMFVAIVLNLNRLPPQIPLFFSKSWGEDQLADTWMIVSLPLILNIFYFANNYFYKKYFVGNEFVKKAIRYFNIFLIVSITLIFIKIITLIT